MPNKMTGGKGIFGAVKAGTGVISGLQATTATISTMALGGGTRATKLYRLSATIAPAGTATSNHITEIAYTTGLTSITSTDHILAFEPVTAMVTGLGVAGVRVSASGTISVKWANNTTADITTLPTKWKIVGIKF